MLTDIALSTVKQYSILFIVHITKTVFLVIFTKRFVVGAILPFAWWIDQNARCQGSFVALHGVPRCVISVVLPCLGVFETLFR